MSLLSATRNAVELAPPIPVNNKIFAAAGLVFRRAQFSLVCSAPGVGKTLFATNLAINAKTPVLYFSADSDEWTQRQRACSVITSYRLDDVEKHLNSGDRKWAQYYTDRLHEADHIDWSFQPDLDDSYIVRRIMAHAEMRGLEMPGLVIVDNLLNCVQDEDNEGNDLKGISRELHRIARKTKAHVMGLHHVKGAKENGDKPIYLGDLLYNLGKLPETVLGLHRSGENTVTLTAPKYRGGKSGMALHLPLDYSTATVGGYVK